MPDRAAVVQRFAADLRLALFRAGAPSLATLERLSTQLTRPVRLSGLRVMVLSDSTTADILHGRRRGLPKWQWVASFITVLRVAVAQAGLDPDVVGTVDEWKAKHEAALGGAAGTATETDETAGAFPGGEGRALEMVGARPTAAAWRPAGIHSLVKRARALSWWGDYADVVPDWFEIYLSLEPSARIVHTYEPEFIPGLLQTPGYAMAAIGLDHATASSVEIGRRVALRMRRQKILHRPNAPRLWAVIEEAALRDPPGDAAMMRAQLQHLIALCEYPHITVQVMPLARDGGRAAAGGPVTILRFAEAELPDLVYLEQRHNAIYPAERRDIEYYGQVFDSLAVEAENPASTIEILHTILSGT